MVKALPEAAVLLLSTLEAEVTGSVTRLTAVRCRLPAAQDLRARAVELAEMPRNPPALVTPTHVHPLVAHRGPCGAE